MFVRVTFTGNVAAAGGGAFYTNAASAGSDGMAVPEFYNTTFRENVASDGGAVYTFDSSPVIVNPVFWKNEADSDGGALFASEGSAVLVNASFAENSADGSGGTLYSSSPGAAVELSNVVLWGGTPDGIAGTHSTGSTADESVLQGGCPTGFTCTAVLDQDPVFVDAAGVVMEPIPVDLENDPRVLDVRGGGAIVDMGAYERP